MEKNKIKVGLFPTNLKPKTLVRSRATFTRSPWNVEEVFATFLLLGILKGRPGSLGGRLRLVPECFWAVPACPTAPTPARWLSLCDRRRETNPSVLMWEAAALPGLRGGGVSPSCLSASGVCVKNPFASSQTLLFYGPSYYLSFNYSIELF